MRVAIDISPIQSEHQARGVGSYTRLLIKSLERYDKNNSYYFFTRGQKIPKDVNLVHYPYFDPFFLTLPLFKPRSTVVTVHDLIPLAFPREFPRGWRGEIKWQIQRFSLQNASRVISDSQASKRDLVQLAGLPEKKIEVIYLAPAPNFHKISEPALLDRVKKKYQLPDDFILYVGDVNWNKNIEGLVKAFSALNSELSARGKATQLILVGKAFLQNELPEVQRINQLITQLGLTNNIHKLGYVPEEDLPVIYSLASVYVQPSFAEGFGLPVLEALACGCPVAAAKSSSLNEIAGPANLFDPQKKGEIAGAMRALISLDFSRRGQLIMRGLDWVKNFSWQKVAKKTVATYEKTLAGV